MINTIDAPEVEQESLSRKQYVYKVGDRVLYTALVNNPGHYKPGEKLSGTVINAFRNPEALTYRIELDMTWNERVPDTCGRKIVVGNVTAWSMSSIA